MTSSAAIPNEIVSVLGVNLEVLRIAAPLARCDWPSQSAPVARQQAHRQAHAPAAQPSPLASPIVFLHEGLGSVAMWRDFPQTLCAATGHPGLVYSRRGYGQSDTVPDVRGAGRLKPDYMHCEAWAVLPELLRIEGIEKPILLGHSDGATIALLHAAKFDVAACIVMAPHLFVEDICIAAITQARDAFERGELRERLAKFHADVDCTFWQWNDVWLCDAWRSFNIEAECKKITCPILAIQGHDDPYGTMAQIDALADSMANLSSQIGQQPAQNMRRLILKLEHCGHSPQRDQMQNVTITIQDFLSSLADGK